MALAAGVVLVDGARGPRARAEPLGRIPRRPSEKEKGAELAQKLGQLQPFVAAFPQECMGQPGSFGPTSHLPRSQDPGFPLDAIADDFEHVRRTSEQVAPSWGQAVHVLKMGF